MEEEDHREKLAYYFNKSVGSHFLSICGISYAIHDCVLEEMCGDEEGSWNLFDPLIISALGKANISLEEARDFLRKNYGPYKEKSRCWEETLRSRGR